MTNPPTNERIAVLETRVEHVIDRMDCQDAKLDRLLKMQEDSITLGSLLKNKYVLSFGLVIFANSTGMGIKGAIDLIKVIFT